MGFAQQGRRGQGAARQERDEQDPREDGTSHVPLVPGYSGPMPVRVVLAILSSLLVAGCFARSAPPIAPRPGRWVIMAINQTHSSAREVRYDLVFATDGRLDGRAMDGSERAILDGEFVSRWERGMVRLCTSNRDGDRFDVREYRLVVETAERMVGPYALTRHDGQGDVIARSRGTAIATFDPQQ